MRKWLQQQLRTRPRRVERVRRPLRRATRQSPWWADCQAAMDVAVAFRLAGCQVLVCAAVPGPRVLVVEVAP